MSNDLFLVPVVNVRSLACETIAMSAPSEAAAIWGALQDQPWLRYTGGTIERRPIPTAEDSIARDTWSRDYWRPGKLEITR